jgi:hypothetical protein
MTALLYVLLAYLAVCWLWGLYLAVRLYTGRRLTRLLRGQSIRARAIHPLTREAQGPQTQPATARTAQALAKSRAA